MSKTRTSTLQNFDFRFQCEDMGDFVPMYTKTTGRLLLSKQPRVGLNILHHKQKVLGLNLAWDTFFQGWN